MAATARRRDAAATSADDRLADFGGMELRPSLAKPGQARLLLNAETVDGTVRKRRGSVPYATRAGATLCHGLFPIRSPLGLAYVAGVFRTGALTADVVVWTGVNVKVARTAVPALNDPTRLATAATVEDDTVITGPWDGPPVVIRCDHIDGEISIDDLRAVNRADRGQARLEDDPGPWLPDPPRGRFCCSFADRVFMAGMPGRPNQVAWSNLRDVYGWPNDNTADANDDTSEPPTGLVPLHGGVVVLKPSSIWMLVGDFRSAGGTEFRKVVDGVGCLAPGSVERVDDRLLFLSREGPMAFNGVSVEPIGGSLRPLFVPERTWPDLGPDIVQLRAAASSLSRARSVHLAARNLYVLAVDAETGSSWSTWYIHHCRSDGWMVWTGQQASAMTAALDAFGNESWLTADLFGRVVLQDRGGADSVWDAGSGQVARQSINFVWEPVPPGYGQKTQQRPRFIRVTARTAGTPNVTVTIAPGMQTFAAGAATSTLAAGGADARALYGASGFRLGTDRVLTAAYLDVKRGVAGYPSSTWRVRIEQNGLDAPVEIASLGFDWAPAQRR